MVINPWIRTHVSYNHYKEPVMMLWLPYHSPSAGIPSPHMLSYKYIYIFIYNNIHIYIYNTVPCLDHDTYRCLWMVTGIECCFCFKSTICMLNLAFGATRFCPKDDFPHGVWIGWCGARTRANNVGPQLGIAKLVALARLTVGFMVVLTK